MKISLIFMTGRKDPHLDWALDTLAPQTRDGDEIQLIIVDALAYRAGGREAPYFVEQVAPFLDLARLSSVIMTPPKPNIWQGDHRVTKVDWWATANARNTGIALAEYDYLVFLDDRARLGPKWLETVRRYHEARDAVVCGSYDKLEGTPGNPTRATDHRRGLYPNGLKNCGGGWLYGCTFALPLQWALKVNGFEEGCDGLTSEDYIFGLMLGNNGHRIDFDPNMFVEQDRTTGNETCKGTYKCRDKGVAPNDKSHAALERFGKSKRTEFTPNLVDLRRGLSEGNPWPEPIPGHDYRDWFDGQLIREMDDTP